MQSDEDAISLLPRNTSQYPTEEEGDISEPISADDSSTHLRWHREPSRHRFLQRLRSWLLGPQPPRPWKIQPFAIEVQFNDSFLALSKLVSKTHPGAFWLVLSSSAYCICFILVIVWSERFCAASSYGAPVRLSCVDKFWRGTTECGLDGVACRPFHNDDPLFFRCPANCQTAQVWEPHTIGNFTFAYQSMIIGGNGNANFSNIYRGDTFICAAAIQSGLFKGSFGGSGIGRLIGEYANYTGKHANGLTGFDFHSSFPQSFTLASEPSVGCSDPRWIVLALSVLYTSIIAISPASSACFYGLSVIASYFCTALAVDAPEPDSFAMVVSLAFRGFLPAAFVGYVVYIWIVRKTLDRLNAPLQRCILWLGPHWVGALENMSFDRLPLQRLTPHDLVQPGALLVLISISLTILLTAVGQIWAFQKEGRLIKYLIFYAGLILGVMLLASIPGLLLRIHHYILALLLLPGTAIQTRPSLVYQGLLTGLFVNGIARWGFDSILQTAGDLFAEDLDTMVPKLSLPSIQDDTIEFSWPEASAISNASLSILVNDVERFREYEDHQTTSFKWTRTRRDQDHYFRVGCVREGKVTSSRVGRYSDPGIWLANGTWVPIPDP